MPVQLLQPKVQMLEMIKCFEPVQFDLTPSKTHCDLIFITSHIFISSDIFVAPMYELDCHDA